MVDRDQLFNSAERLHAHLLKAHYKRGLLTGPDSGVRFNLRAWRFFKSALPFIPWRDHFVFIQTQGYWVLSNWMLFEATGVKHYREIALGCTEATRQLQQPEGFWLYPLRERKNLVATVEGDWGAIALLASYAREPRPGLLQAAVRWYEYLIHHIGFQNHSSGKAINYYHRPRGKVLNNSVEAAWLFARLWKAGGEERFLEHFDALLDFVADAQLDSGELPYIVESTYERERVHYLCFQYNAFQFLKLAWVDSLRPGTRAPSIIAKLAGFLARGVLPSGASATDCFTTGGGGPEVDYYSAVLAAALHEGAQYGLPDAAELSQRCYGRCLARQRPDGSFGFSTGDYGLLRDTRSYPRAQAMTLFHLLLPDCGDGFARKGESQKSKVKS
ncbi:MAG TPA: hypothetical protein VG028_17730 [Terriglobia bacterium]|nr:hypothetical protein [Terriglobia bacterium]